MIYSLIVQNKLRRAFAALNRGDHAPVLAAFGSPVEHVFYGEHALGGERHCMASIRPWYARLKTLFPDLQFDIGNITVGGMPWNTVAMVEWRDRLSLPDGSRRANQGVHVLRLRWGKVISLHVYCDTLRLQSVLRELQAQGVTAAGLAPIEDRPLADPLLAAA
jgi:ketosteroid isomerase-like protein